MLDELRSRRIDIGESVVTRMNGQSRTKIMTVDGRKRPLSKMRKKLFEKTQIYTRLND